MRENIDKTFFVCVDKDENYNIQLFPKHINIPNAKPEEEFGKLKFNIILDHHRTEFLSQRPPFDVINYAKRLIEVKGRGKCSKGKARIVWLNLNDNKEYCCAIVEKIITRKYVPIESKRKKVKL